MAMVPTGRRRYRVLHRWLRKPLLILQVEETGREFSYSGGFVDSFTVRRWRDARPEDIMVHEMSSASG